jgi:hypothetical protein
MTDGLLTLVVNREVDRSAAVNRARMIFKIRRQSHEEVVMSDFVLIARYGSARFGASNSR